MSLSLSPNPAAPGAPVTVSLTGYPAKKAVRTVYNGTTSPSKRTSTKGSATFMVTAATTTMPLVIEAYTNRQWAPYGASYILRVAVTTGITNVTVACTPTSATIAWDVVPPATGQLQTVSPTGQVQTTPLEATPRTHHAQTVTGLAPGLTYRYTITSGGTHADTFTTCWAP